MLEGQIPIEDYESGNTKNKWNLNKIKLEHKTILKRIFKRDTPIEHYILI